MVSRNTLDRYGTVAVTLHWVIAALIATNLAIGFYFANVMDEHDPSFFSLVQIHKSIGLTVLSLSVLRLVWRLMNPVPTLPTDFGIHMRRLARGTHYVFYFLIIAVPLLGWLMVSASPLGTPTSYFGLFHWPALPFFSGLSRSDRHQYHEALSTAHAIFAYTAFGLMLLHAGAALWHHFVRRDNVLKRMLPGTKIPTT